MLLDSNSRIAEKSENFSNLKKVLPVQVHEASRTPNRTS
jgi:hypothetical protein